MVLGCNAVLSDGAHLGVLSYTIESDTSLNAEICPKAPKTS